MDDPVLRGSLLEDVGSGGSEPVLIKLRCDGELVLLDKPLDVILTDAGGPTDSSGGSLGEGEARGVGEEGGEVLGAGEGHGVGSCHVRSL